MYNCINWIGWVISIKFHILIGWNGKKSWSWWNNANKTYLIISHRLFPIELWMQSTFFLLLLISRTCHLHNAKRVCSIYAQCTQTYFNFYLLEIIFHFIRLAWHCLFSLNWFQWILFFFCCTCRNHSITNFWKTSIVLSMNYLLFGSINLRCRLPHSVFMLNLHWHYVFVVFFSSDFVRTQFLRIDARQLILTLTKCAHSIYFLIKLHYVK